MKDKGNPHGEVGISSLEQQFCKSAAITFIVWSPTPSATRFYSRQAGWLADEIQVNFSKFSKLPVGRNIRFVALFN